MRRARRVAEEPEELLQPSPAEPGGRLDLGRRDVRLTPACATPFLARQAWSSFRPPPTNTTPPSTASTAVRGSVSQLRPPASASRRDLRPAPPACRSTGAGRLRSGTVLGLLVTRCAPDCIPLAAPNCIAWNQRLVCGRDEVLPGRFTPGSGLGAGLASPCGSLSCGFGSWLSGISSMIVGFRTRAPSGPSSPVSSRTSSSESWISWTSRWSSCSSAIDPIDRVLRALVVGQDQQVILGNDLHGQADLVQQELQARLEPDCRRARA